MKKFAIISYYHTESSLCLAKNVANTGISVDYYFFRLLPTDTGRVPGIEYQRAKRVLGLHHLSPEEIPEMINYMNKNIYMGNQQGNKNYGNMNPFYNNYKN